MEKIEDKTNYAIICFLTTLPILKNLIGLKLTKKLRDCLFVFINENKCFTYYTT